MFPRPSYFTGAWPGERWPAQAFLLAREGIALARKQSAPFDKSGRGRLPNAVSYSEAEQSDKVRAEYENTYAEQAGQKH